MDQETKVGSMSMPIHVRTASAAARKKRCHVLLGKFAAFVVATFLNRNRQQIEMLLHDE